jgi:hypothetical protein
MQKPRWKHRGFCLPSGNIWTRILNPQSPQIFGYILRNFDSPRFGQVLTYWQSIAIEAAPRVSEFDLIQIPTALPDITLWEMHPDGRVVCRMAGTAVIARMKSDITGVEISQVMPPKAGINVVDDVQAILAQPCALYQLVLNRHVTGKIARMESLIMPLAADAGGMPRFVSVNHMIETVRYGSDEHTGELELMRSLEERTFLDLGWGVPDVENFNQQIS